MRPRRDRATRLEAGRSASIVFPPEGPRLRLVYRSRPGSSRGRRPCRCEARCLPTLPAGLDVTAGIPAARTGGSSVLGPVLDLFHGRASGRPVVRRRAVRPQSFGVRSPVPAQAVERRPFPREGALSSHVDFPTRDGALPLEPPGDRGAPIRWQAHQRSRSDDGDVRIPRGRAVTRPRSSERPRGWTPTNTSKDPCSQDCPQ